MPQQAARYEHDIWAEKISDYLGMNTRVTIGMVANAIGIETPRVGRTDQTRIAAAMERLGWERERPIGRSDREGRVWWTLGRGDVVT